LAEKKFQYKLLIGLGKKKNQMTKGEAELNKMRDQLYDDDDQSCPSTEMDEFHEMLMDEDIHDDTLLSENPNEGLA
jgi:hypothetical protein